MFPPNFQTRYSFIKIYKVHIKMICLHLFLFVKLSISLLYIDIFFQHQSLFPIFSKRAASWAWIASVPAKWTLLRVAPFWWSPTVALQHHSLVEMSIQNKKLIPVHRGYDICTIYLWSFMIIYMAAHILCKTSQNRSMLYKFETRKVFMFDPTWQQKKQ